MKNPASARSRSLREAVKDVGRRLALTGTPLQTNMEELHHLINFVVPGAMCDTKLKEIQSIVKAGRADPEHSLPAASEALEAWRRDTSQYVMQRGEEVLPGRGLGERERLFS